MSLVPRWKPAQRLRRVMPADVAAWVFDPGSLTARLQARCPDAFRVHVLFQGRRRPQANESAALGLRRCGGAVIRQVHLYCGDLPVVFARTVIPVATLTGRTRRLGHLRNKPLGAVLFADPGMRRGELEAVRLLPGMAGFDVVTGSGPAESSRQGIWGRRSVFHVDGKPLLVSEIFLPALFEA